jgi:hypothetical protein
MNTVVKSARKCITKLQSHSYKKFNESLRIDNTQTNSEIINLFINTHGSIWCPLSEKNAGDNTFLNRIIFTSSGCVALSSTLGNIDFINDMIKHINEMSFFTNDCISSDDLKHFNDMVFDTEQKTSGRNNRYMEQLPKYFEKDESRSTDYPKFLKHSLELQEGVNINNKYYNKIFTPFGLLTDDSQYGSGIFLLSDFKYSDEYDFKKEIENELFTDAKMQFKNDNYKDYDQDDEDDVDIFNDTYKYLLQNEMETNKLYNMFKSNPNIVQQDIQRIIPKKTNLMEHPLFIKYIQDKNPNRKLIIILNDMEKQIQVLDHVFLDEVISFFKLKLKNSEPKLFNIIDTSCEVLHNLSSDRERRCLIRDITKSNIRGGLKRKNGNKTKKNRKTKKHKKYNKTKYIKGYKTSKSK